MVNLVKLVKVGHSYTFSNLVVNPRNVATVEDDYGTGALLREDKNMFPDGLDPAAKFSIVVADGQSHTVVGTANEVKRKLGHKQLLHG